MLTIPQVSFSVILLFLGLCLLFFGFCPLLVYNCRAALLNLLFVLLNLLLYKVDILVLALLKYPVEVVNKRDFSVPNSLYISVFPIILPVLAIVHGLPNISHNR